MTNTDIRVALDIESRSVVGLISQKNGSYIVDSVIKAHEKVQ